MAPGTIGDWFRRLPRLRLRRIVHRSRQHAEKLEFRASFPPVERVPSIGLGLLDPEGKIQYILTDISHMDAPVSIRGGFHHSK